MLGVVQTYQKDDPCLRGLKLTVLKMLSRYLVGLTCLHYLPCLTHSKAECEHWLGGTSLAPFPTHSRQEWSGIHSFLPSRKEGEQEMKLSYHHIFSLHQLMQLLHCDD